MLALLASTDRAGDITIGGSTDEGTTVLRPAALVDALTSEVSAYHGVDSAKGRIIGDGRDPEVVLTVVTAPAADLRALHHRIEAEAFAHARQATGNPPCPSSSTLPNDSKAHALTSRLHCLAGCGLSARRSSGAGPRAPFHGPG